MKSNTLEERKPTRLFRAVAVLCLNILMVLSSTAAENVLSFSSMNHRIATTGQVTTVNFTFEAWVRMTSATAENQILSQYQPGHAGRMIFALKNNTPAFFIGSWMDGTAVDVSNKWTHLAVTRNGSTCTIYVNGTLNKSGTINTNILSPAGIYIGGINILNSGFRGQIADVRAWTVTRSQAEIQQTMNLRLTGNETGLAYYWRMNEGTGSIVYDAMAKALPPANGTITGATWATSDLPIVSDVSQGAWNALTGGFWSVPANWLDGTIASGANTIAYFTNQPPAAITVTNDLASLRIGNLTVSSLYSHTFTGNAITLTNEFIVPRLVTTAGVHTVKTPLLLTAAGLSVESQNSGGFTLSGLISGTGGLTVNPTSSGGGLVTLTGPNTYTGPTVLGCGTLSVDALANGGVASSLGASSAASSNMRLGPGTFRYTGGNATTDRGFTVQAGSNPAYAAVFQTDANLTFGGQIQAASGCFIKTGSGTLSFTYPGLNVYIATEGNANALQNLTANGDSPTTGFSGLVISNGKIVMGAPGQTNQFVNRIDIGACTTTNANAETTGELEIVDGVFICPTTFSVGRHNGTRVTAGPEGLSARFTVSGGYAFVSLLAMGNNTINLTGYNARPVVEVSGGELEVNNYLNASESAGALSTINVRNSGTLRFTGTNDSCARIGISGIAILTLSDNGNIYASTDLRLAWNTDGKGIINLNGGTLAARNITRGSGTNACVNFNGGIFKPHTSGRSLSGLTAASVLAGGACIDTTLADYTIVQNLLHDSALGATRDGGLVKLGSGTLTLTSTGSTYTGPTVVSNGVLRLIVNPPTSSDLQVASEGELLVGGSATQTLAAASVALTTGGTLGFAFKADGSSNDRLVLSATPELANGRMALYLQDTELPFTRNGTYTLLTYSGTAPEVTTLTCANPVFGKRYSFAATAGTVTVTIDTDTAGASVWNVNASGNWADSGNWTQLQPGTAGSAARFDDVIDRSVTVTTAGEHVGAIYFNQEMFTYTLDGSGLTLDNGGTLARVSVERGNHAITAPLTLASDAVIDLAPNVALMVGSVSGPVALTAQGNGAVAFTTVPAVTALTLNVAEVGLSNSMTVTLPVQLQRAVAIRPATGTTVTFETVLSGNGGLTQAGSSFLIPTAANTYTGPTAVNAGTLRVAALTNGGAASAIGASSAASGNLVIGAGTLHITGLATTDRGYTLRTVDTTRAGVLRVDDEVTFGGQILADSGAFVKTGPGTVTYTYPGNNQLNRHQSYNSGGIQNISAYGDSPTTGFTGFTVSQGKIVLGVPGQTNNAVRIEIGSRTTVTAGQETAGEIVLNNGVLNSSDTVSIGRNNGTTTTAPGGLSSRLTVNGGICNFPILAMGNNGAGLSGYNARPVIEVNGGQVNVSGTYLSVGETTGASASVFVSGGTVNIYNASCDLRIGGGQTATDNSGSGTVRLSGGGFIHVARNVSLGFGNNGQGEFHLDGGTLRALTITGGNGSRKEFWFNGGVFLPHTSGQTMNGLTAAYVSTNGAIFDTALASYTVAQNMLTDPALVGAADGGLLKISTNTLSLTGTGNTFNGPVRVQMGLLRARFGATNDLSVAADATFDALGETCTVGNLTGNGLLTNGVIRITRHLDAGTNRAPAGASMTVQNLTLASGSCFMCDWATNTLGQVTNDTVNVTETLTPQGAGYFDLGRSHDNPIPMPFELTIMSYQTLGSPFVGWKAINTGLPENMAYAVVTTAKNGWVTVKVQYGGTLISIR